MKKLRESLLQYSLLGCILLNCAFFQTALAQETNIIALLGDSITIGENSDFPAAFRPMRGFGRRGNDGVIPALPGSDKLDTLLDNENRESTVMNWGRGGSNSGLDPFNGAERIARELQFVNDNFSADNRYVLILYGTNDFGSGISESSTAFHTSLMIDRARALGFTPVIGTLTPRLGGGNIPSRNSQIVAAANSRGAPIVDHYARFIQDGAGGLNLIDVEVFNGVSVRLHPTLEGYDVIARTWFDEYLAAQIPENIPTEIPVDSAAGVVITPIITLVLDD